MAGEYKRARGKKKIKLPGGDEMFIPALTGISFIDPRDRYQETQYSIDNSAAADRDVHVDDVFPTAVDADGVPTSDPATQDRTGTPLKVERIDTWKVLDPRNRYQETAATFDNKTGADDAPPHFSTHQKTHIYRYYKDPNLPNNDGTWIDSELIDELARQDPRSRYQEDVHYIDNPTNAQFRDGDLSGQVTEDDPDITIGDSEGTEDNPVRIDPFQNIVNFHDMSETPSYSLVFYVNFLPVDGSTSSIVRGSGAHITFDGSFTLSTITAMSAKFDLALPSGVIATGFPLTSGENRIPLSGGSSNRAIFNAARLYTTGGANFRFEMGGLCCDGDFIWNFDWPTDPGRLASQYPSAWPFPDNTSSFGTVDLDFSAARLEFPDGKIFAATPTTDDPCYIGSDVLPHEMWATTSAYFAPPPGSDFKIPGIVTPAQANFGGNTRLSQTSYLLYDGFIRFMGAINFEQVTA